MELASVSGLLILFSFFSSKHTANGPFLHRRRFHFSVLHYRISCLSDGGFALAGTQDQVFGDPLQLVENVEGLATKPLHPCQRCVEAILPPTYWGLSEEQVKKFILLRSRQWGLDVSIRLPYRLTGPVPPSRRVTK